jgi:SAM-dependent methyltransferase
LPRVPDALLELQDTLYASRNPTRRWLHHERRRWIEASLRRAAERGARTAAEIGPGSGVYLPLLCELFDEVVAADVEEAFLGRARELAAGRPDLRVVRDDVTASALGTFDVVLCTEVLEHVPDPLAALRGLRRLLAPGGTLVLSTPQRHSTVEVAGRVAFRPGVLQILRLVYREPILPMGHVSLMTERQLRAALADAGLTVDAAGKTGLYLPLAAEAGGERAQRLSARLARRIRGTRLDALLWTQLYELRAGSHAG